MFIALDGKFAVAVGDSKGQVYRILTQMGYNAEVFIANDAIKEVPDNPELMAVIKGNMLKKPKKFNI